MNNKITMPALVALLALKSGLSKEKSEEFLKEFFKLISDTLKEGESVKIKALGTFKIMSVETRKSVNVTNGEEIVIPGHNRIVFVPSREIADEINAPFSMFDSVELNPEAEEEIMSSLFTEEIVSQSETVAQPTLPISEKGEEEEEELIIENEKNDEKIIEEEKADEEIVEGKESGNIEENAVDVEEKKDIEEKKETDEEKEKDDNNEGREEEIRREEEEEIKGEIEKGENNEEEIVVKKGKGKMRFAMGFISGLVAAMLLAGAGYYFAVYRNFGNLENNHETIETPADTTPDAVKDLTEEADGNLMEEVQPEASDSSAIREVTPKEESPVAETQPSDKEVKDIIGPHNYLTTMAQRHYGDYNLWAYIYEENKSFLGHPDRIKPGTEVVVPPLSKYGIDPKNPDDVKKAKRLGIEIYKRFK
ncbi:MAG: HU family DNA-binding protein [Muribaculaceae bacterium]|nr:HU family DNA-binding protein [Muribaculaceae bacterium]